MKIFNDAKRIMFLVAFAAIAAIFAALALACPFAPRAEAYTLSALADGLQDVQITAGQQSYEYSGSTFRYAVNGLHRDLDFVLEYRVSGTEPWAADEPKNVGSYDVKITRAADETYNAYEKIVDKGLIINPCEITVSVQPVPKGTAGYTYDKTPKTTTFSVSGNSTGENIVVKLGYRLGDFSSEDGGVDAGEWTVYVASVSVEDGDVNNYTVNSDATATMVIEPKEVELTWQSFGADELVYDGNAKTPSATVSQGLVGGDECAVSETKLESGDNVNAGRFTYRALSLTNSNYKLSENAVSPEYEITKKSVSLTIVDVPSGTDGYVYDGTAKSTSAVSEGLVGEDRLGYELGYEMNGDSAAVNAGVWQVKIEHAYITIGNSNNYSIDYSDTGEMVIDKKPVYITINDVFSGTEGYTYDGTEKRTDVRHTELVGSDVLTAVLKYGLAEKTADAGVSAGEWTVTIASVEFTTGRADNYEVDYSDVGTMVIDRREVTLTWQTLSADELVYDGKEKIPAATAGNLVGDEECSVAVRISSGGDNIDVGKFSFVAYALSSSDYKLPEKVNSPEYEITRRRLIVTAKSYDVIYGDAIESFEILYDGFADGDDEAVLDKLPTITCSYTYRTGVIASGMKISVQGGSDGNYSFKYVEGVINISVRPITVTADDKVTVEGAALAELTFSSTEIVAGDAFIGSLFTSADPNKPDHYLIDRGTLTLNDNYEITFNAGTYTVNARNKQGMPVENGLSSAISAEEGIDPSATFTLVKRSVSEMDWFELPEGKAVVMGCFSELANDESEHRQYTIRIEIPSGISGSSGLSVITLGKNGEAVERQIRVDGDYLYFSTDNLGEFVIVQNKTSYVGIIAVFALIAVLFMGFFLWYLIKRRRDFSTKVFD